MRAAPDSLLATFPAAGPSKPSSGCRASFSTPRRSLPLPPPLLPPLRRPRPRPPSPRSTWRPRRMPTRTSRASVVPRSENSSYAARFIASTSARETDCMRKSTSASAPRRSSRRNSAPCSSALPAPYSRRHRAVDSASGETASSAGGQSTRVRVAWRRRSGTRCHRSTVSRPRGTPSRARHAAVSSQREAYSRSRRRSSHARCRATM
mmetsp:Transcript_16670/g.53221  ORF Transcript_16670/g.53221 Transcript_16670/m.53221 type:complete len:207 (-) Transcript_16670:271-891(-)